MSRVVRFPKTGLLPLTLAVTSALSATAYAEEQTEAYELNKVVVTASSTEHLETTAPASITVITGDEIKEKSGGDVVEALRQTVGMNVTQGGIGGRQTMGMRGLDGKYTVMMIDGRRINASETLIRANDFDVSTIPVDSIERIEIVRGPMSSLYGADAMGGVVNIITKSASNKWAGSLSYDYYSVEGNDGGNEHRTSLYLSGPLIQDKLTLTLNGDFRDRDAWKPYENNSTSSIDESTLTPLENKDVKNLRSVFGWKISEQQSLDVELAKNSDDRKSVYNLGNKATNADQKIDRETYALTHKGKWGWGDTQIRGVVEKSEVRDNIDRTDLNMHPGTIYQTNQTLDGMVTTELGNHLLTTGAEITKTKLENSRDLKNTGEAKVTKKAIFAQDEWFLSDNWTATIGGRLDHHSDFGSHFSPRGYLVYTPTEALTLKGGVGQAYKTPTIAQLNEDFHIISCGGNCFIKGNPDLKPEKSTSYELSANYVQPMWSVGATVYRNEIEDMIDRLTKSDGSRTWTNINEARVQGVELTGSRILTKTVSVSANYAYTDARDRSDSKYNDLLTNRPRQSFNVQLDWEAMKNLKTFVNFKYIGEQQKNATTDLPGYNLVDLGLNYKYSKELSFRTGITNLGDTRLNERDENFDYMERGRTYYVGVTASF